jgi:hypothetical protein
MRAILILSAIATLGFGLCGCVAYDVASTAVDATTTVVGGAADVAGAVVTAPFGRGDSSDKPKDSD